MKSTLIDSDPQFNATQAFIDPEDYLKSENHFKLFKPQTELHQSLCNAKKRRAGY